MNLADYIKTQGHGAKSRLARAIKSHPVDVGNWVHGKCDIPVRRAVQIEKATAGAVTRQEMRPNDWADYWPELANEAAPTQPQPA